MAEFTLREQRSDVRISRYAPGLEVIVDGRAHQVEPLQCDSPDSFKLRIDDKVIQGACRTEGDRVYLRLNGNNYTLVRHELQGPGQRGAQTGEICAELPGNLVSIHCAPGDEVRSGDLLMITESMKMEVRVLASSDGRVEEVCLAPGQSFEQGAALLRLKST